MFIFLQVVVPLGANSDVSNKSGAPETLALAGIHPHCTHGLALNIRFDLFMP